MNKASLPVGITSGGLSQEASRIFEGDDPFSYRRAVHLMLFSEISSNGTLFDEYLSHKVSLYLLETSTQSSVFSEVVTYLTNILRNAVEQLKEDSTQEDARFCIDACELAAENLKGIASDTATFQASEQADLRKFFKDTIPFVATMQSAMATVAPV